VLLTLFLGTNIFIDKHKFMKISDIKLAVVGLGYVGLPLAVEFAKKRNVIGFDINLKRIEELKKGFDKTLEIKAKELKKTKKLKFTNSIKDLLDVNCYIITVPTPVDKNKKPDLTPLLLATRTIGKIIKHEDIVIYESTVYPGCIEEKCVPVLEKLSGLRYNKNFFCGYSPERVNPGDKIHKIKNIKKIVSGSNKYATNIVDQIYKQIITAGTHKANSIKVAEAAKVIENTQRDLNIALINELSILFNRMSINTQAVLKAAGTKWNFLPFKPGLVGGHCIGVDPYYLTHKAKSIGYDPKIILAGRRLNDNMGRYVASKLIREMKKKSILIKKSKILIMGLTFKENCPDLRNSGVTDIIKKLINHKCKIHLHDPWTNDHEVLKTYKIKPIKKLKNNHYDVIIIAVAHKQFKKMGIDKIMKLAKKKKIIFDLKNLFGSTKSDFQL